MGGRAALAACLSLVAAPAAAQWPISPALNLPVCTAVGDQAEPVAAPDGAGGAYIAWADRRGGATWDLYVQRLTGAGAIAPGWPVCGIAVSTNSGSQANIAIAADGSGGVLLAWQDRRPGHYDVYAQRVRASGALAAGWPAGGRPVCTTAGDQGAPALAPDGQGGCYVAWRDDRNGYANADIHVTRVQGSGNIPGGWTANGLAVCAAPGVQESPALVADRNGAIVSWQDARDPATGWDIRAGRVNPGGNLAGGWPANGVAVCAVPGDQFTPAVASDGSGGIIAAWEDRRSGAGSDVYAMRITSGGSAASGWPAGGRALCTAPGEQFAVEVVADGLGGAVVAWEDQRKGFDDADIAASRVTTGGAIAAGWPEDGVTVCAAPGMQMWPVLAWDPAQGAMLAWMDERAGASQCDIYAGRLTPAGARPATWPADGRTVGGAAGRQVLPALALDATGAAIVAWRDFRGGATSDVYAQRVQADALLGSAAARAVAVADVPGDAGGAVSVSWSRSDYDTPPAVSAAEMRVARYDVQRMGAATAASPQAARTVGTAAAEPAWAPAGAGDPVRAPAGAPDGTGPAEWATLASVGATGAASYSVTVPTVADATPGEPALHAFRVVAVGDDGERAWPSGEARGASADDLGDPAAAPGDAPLESALGAPGPNPARGPVTLPFTLARAQRVRLEVHDIAGRLVWRLADGAWPAGRHRVRWDGYDAEGHPSPSGLYVVRLVREDGVSRRRLVLAR
jgi:hypothetical protein